MICRIADIMNIDIFRRIGIVGSGRVARALALGLKPASHEPPLLWGRSPARLIEARSQVDGIDTTTTLGALTEACDAIAIAVADDAIAGIVTALAIAASTTEASPFVFHVSGRSGAALLAPLHDAGWTTAAIHPAMTFTGNPPGEVARMAGARFAITGSSVDAAVQARRVVGLLGGVAVEIPEERRALYHAALCHASNHLVTLIADAAQALERAGVDAPRALLAPLVQAALDNSLDRGFDALSGPLLRGDVQTIRDHVAALAAHDPDLVAAYRAMAMATIDRLEHEGARPDAALRRALDSSGAVP
ncbi:Rossmann-like and DUF2520 domain-containing protein [uncultured Sphingopyxis sp.]|jgi:predicted short-subunit dehydrogenase-like oxidoreductase (DUF2520 family)|uniref:Rossmann-like and DUF2520 domain-containing protein n=1 Tax=uncultured Sphingopyxis sp. TaxID=310581 RepID=UPI000B1E35AE|nr:Rossmann-like and DUF2520 domain-containing protein [uncultured Sphingopyxis sp.]